MIVKVFVLGRSGSGKSTSVRYLNNAAQQYGWSVVNFNDYDILRSMFLDPTRDKQFRPTEHDGFEVLDFRVYDDALLALEQRIQNFCPSEKDTILTIEFTSNNYLRAMDLFSHDFLQDAHYLFLNVDLLTCIGRVCQRIAQPTTSDDYFVSDVVLFGHYPSPYMPSRIRGKKVKFIDNMGPLDNLYMRLEVFVRDLVKESKLSSSEQSASDSNSGIVPSSSGAGLYPLCG